jgi:ABC-type glycerol-3-phosphate transport system substrate-binding protein
VPDEPPFVSDLSGELHIYSPRIPERAFSFYINRFIELHPDVSIVVEALPVDQLADRAWWEPDMIDLSDQVALNTRLMADPPDIFIPPIGASFEKVVMSGLFTDLNSFIHGPNGIDLDNYFTNIFDAAEQQGGLYLVPIHVSPLDAVRYLNIDLFETIGVDPREFETVNIDELLAYYQRMAAANPDRNIVMSDTFSIMYLLTESPIYDVETLTVNVDTPEMRARFEQALDMRTGRDVTLNPDNWLARYTPRGIAFNTRFMARSDNVYLASFLIFSDLGLFFGADHPNMNFTPVRRISSDGSFRFESEFTLSIMRDSPNQDLAWEFIRFILEFDESVITHRTPTDGPVGYNLYIFHNFFPVNRGRFNAQVYDRISYFYPDIVDIMNLGLVMEIDDAHRERTTTAAIDFIYDIMSSFNNQVRHSAAVFNSLVYPDIWLLHTGQQTVAQTLASIQNRLELYVAE